MRFTAKEIADKRRNALVLIVRSFAPEYAVRAAILRKTKKLALFRGAGAALISRYLMRLAAEERIEVIGKRGSCAYRA